MIHVEVLVQVMALYLASVVHKAYSVYCCLYNLISELAFIHYSETCEFQPCETRTPPQYTPVIRNWQKRKFTHLYLAKHLLCSVTLTNEKLGYKKL
jgi:hypothetical protein